MAKHMPLIERFFEKVDKSGNKKFPDCWIWDGGRTSKNYGSFAYYTKKPAIGVKFQRECLFVIIATIRLALIRNIYSLIQTLEI